MEKAVKCGMRKFEYDRNENESELITLKCGREKLRTCLVIVFKNTYTFDKKIVFLFYFKHFQLFL